MATTLPTVYPVGYAGTILDFLQTKVDRDGALRIQTGVVSITSATTSTTLVGLIPFNAGAKLSYGSAVFCDDLDTSTNVTLDIGYTYYDSATGSSFPAAFISASTIPQTGAEAAFNALQGMPFTALGDGWVTATIHTGTTTTTGNLHFNLGLAYDASGVTNLQT